MNHRTKNLTQNSNKFSHQKPSSSTGVRNWKGYRRKKKRHQYFQILLFFFNSVQFANSKEKDISSFFYSTNVIREEVHQKGELIHRHLSIKRITLDSTSFIATFGLLIDKQVDPSYSSIFLSLSNDNQKIFSRIDGIQSEGGGEVGVGGDVEVGVEGDVEVESRGEGGGRGGGGGNYASNLVDTDLNNLFTDITHQTGKNIIWASTKIGNLAKIEIEENRDLSFSLKTLFTYIDESQIAASSIDLIEKNSSSDHPLGQYDILFTANNLNQIGDTLLRFWYISRLVSGPKNMSPHQKIQMGTNFFPVEARHQGNYEIVVLGKNQDNYQVCTLSLEDEDTINLEKRFCTEIFEEKYGIKMKIRKNKSPNQVEFFVLKPTNFQSKITHYFIFNPAKDELTSTDIFFNDKGIIDFEIAGHSNETFFLKFENKLTLKRTSINLEIFSLDTLTSIQGVATLTQDTSMILAISHKKDSKILLEVVKKNTCDSSTSCFFCKKDKTCFLCKNGFSLAKTNSGSNCKPFDSGTPDEMVQVNPEVALSCDLEGYSGSSDQCKECEFLIKSSHFNCKACKNGYSLAPISGLCIKETCSVDNCQTCVEGNQNECQLCEINYEIDPTKKCECQNKMNSNPCLSCHSSCKTCNGVEESNCQTCQEKKYSNQGFCHACPDNCLSCTQDGCTLCDANFYIFRKVCEDKTNEISCLNGKYLKVTETAPKKVECLPCSGSCLTCSDKAENCLTCNEAKLLSSGSCLDKCPDGKIEISKECKACHETCLTCNGLDSNHCLSCPLTLESGENKKYLKEGSCVNECGDGYIQSADGKNCLKCGNKCKICITSNPNNCLTCIGSNLLQEKKCVEKCDDGYFKEGGNCQKCSEECATCLEFASYCLSCTDESVAAEGKCTSKCSGKQYYDSGSSSCKPCDSSCENCVSDSKNCLSCPSGSKFLKVDDVHGNRCHSSCSGFTGFYEDSDSSKCLPCDNSCKTCNGPGNDKCLSCKSSKVLEGSVCKDECDTGKGIKFISEIEKVCEECQQDLNCLSCPSNSKECESCGAERDLVDKKCVCKPNFYESSGACFPCHYSCSKCQGSEISDCIECVKDRIFKTIERKSSCVCQDGFIDDQDSKQCLECNKDSKCKTCELDLKKCIDCKEGFALQGDVCTSGCKIGEYQDGDNCSSCHEFCQSCFGPNSNECLSCNSQYFSLGKNNCVDDCTSGYYQDGNKCSKCSSTCSSCSSKNTCIQCAQDHVFKNPSGGEGECVSGCGVNKYRGEKECLSCKNDCETCSASVSDGEFLCHSCKEESYLYNGKECRPSCPGGYFGKDRMCSPCPLTCSLCSSWENCTKCRGRNFLHEGKCEPSCPSTHFKDLKKLKCVQCSGNCKTCDKSASFCTSCSNDKAITSDTRKCFPKSKPLKGYYLQGNQFLKCKSPCSNCISKETQCTSCIEGYLHQPESSTCKLKCEPSFAWAPPNNCKPCHQHCLKCEDSTFHCLQCLDKHEINPENPVHCMILPPKPLVIEKKYFMKKRFMAQIYFSGKIEDNKWNEIFQVKIGDYEPGEETFSFDIKRTSDEKGLEIQFEFFRSNESAPLVIFNTHQKRIISQSTSKEKELNRPSFTEEKIEVDKVSYFMAKSYEKTVEAIQAPSTTSMKTVTASTTIASSSFGVLLIRLIQNFDVLKLIRVEVPSNYINFMKIFETNIFDLIPSLMDKINEGDTCNLDEKLEENEISCYVLNNSGGLIGQIIGYFLLKGLTSIINSSIKNEKNWIKKQVKKLDHLLNLGFFSELFMAVHIDLLLSAFANMRSCWLYPFKLFMNSFISLLIIVFYVYFIQRVIINSFKLEVFKSARGTYHADDLLMEIKRWRFLKGDLKEDAKPGGGMINQVFFLRDFLMCLFIVGGIKNPYLQLIPVIILYIVSLIFTLKYRPYEKKMMNFLMSVNQISYILIMITLLMLKIRESVISEERKFKVYGNILIFSVSLTVVINFIACFIESIIMLKNLIKKWTGKKDKREKITAKEGLPQPEDLDQEAEDNNNNNESRLNLNPPNPVVMHSINSNRRKRRKNRRRSAGMKDEELNEDKPEGKTDILTPSQDLEEPKINIVRKPGEYSRRKRKHKNINSMNERRKKIMGN